jgi:hypothetical protein
VPKLRCTQPDFTTNKTVGSPHYAGAITQYTYDDIIEAYVVSSDENGNFFKAISLQTIGTATAPAVGFSVPVDATNMLISEWE